MKWIGRISHFIFKPFITLIFLIFIVIAGGVCAFLIFQNVFYVPDTIVPSVIGDGLEVAQEKLYKAGLQIKVSGEEFNENISQNSIIKQDPIAGSKVKEHREIYVVVSKGDKFFSVNIPDLRNKELKEAITIIQEYGLTLGKITYTYHFSIPKEKVIAQKPEPGNITSKDKTVNLLVSKGSY